MRINISERLRPFSHEAGTFVPLPQSTLQLQVFPTLVRVFDGDKVLEERPLVGTYKGFTVMLDLEKVCVRVWSQGVPRYCITWDGEVKLEEGKGKSLARPLPRLSLGSHKKLDWTLVRRRLDMREVLPVWYRLGKLMPKVEEHDSGTAFLLKEIERLMEEKQHDKIVEVFEQLFLAGFRGILAPRLIDEGHQGIIGTKEATGSPYVLLTRGAELIEKLFIQADDEKIEILPHLPPQFFSGRFVNLSGQNFEKLNLEWSKKQARRMMLIPRQSGGVKIVLQSGLKTFRLKNQEKELGAVFSNGTLINIERGKRFLFDRFQK